MSTACTACVCAWRARAVREVGSPSTWQQGQLARAVAVACVQPPALACPVLCVGLARLHADSHPRMRAPTTPTCRARHPHHAPGVLGAGARGARAGTGALGVQVRPTGAAPPHVLPRCSLHRLPNAQRGAAPSTCSCRAPPLPAGTCTPPPPSSPTTPAAEQQGSTHRAASPPAPMPQGPCPRACSPSAPPPSRSSHCPPTRPPPAPLPPQPLPAPQAQPPPAVPPRPRPAALARTACTACASWSCCGSAWRACLRAGRWWRRTGPRGAWCSPWRTAWQVGWGGGGGQQIAGVGVGGRAAMGLRGSNGAVGLACTHSSAAAVACAWPWRRVVARAQAGGGVCRTGSGRRARVRRAAAAPPTGLRPRPTTAAHSRVRACARPAPRAGIYLLHFGGAHAPLVQRVAVAGGPLSPATTLCYLPDPTPPRPSTGPALTATGSPGAASAAAATAGAESAGQGGLVFLGSTRANSQLLLAPAPELPRDATDAGAGGAGGCTGGGGGGGSGAPAWTLLDAAAVKCLAPVQACALVPDAQVRPSGA